jgi:uncharacterized protein
MTDNPFQLPDTPKNSFMLLKWLIFEPIQFEEFQETLSKKERILWILKVYTLIILLTLACYFFFEAIIVYFDLPLLFPEEFKPELVQNWSKNFLTDYLLIIRLSYIDLAFSFAGGLGVGLAVSLTQGFKGCLTFSYTRGFPVSLAFSLLGGLTYGLAYGLAVSLAFGLGFGLAVGLIVGLGFGLAVGLIVGLPLSLMVVLIEDFAVGLLVISFPLSFYFSYFRLIFYPFHVIYTFFSSGNFQKNSYKKDGRIYLPIPGAKKKLLKNAWNDPNLAFKFIQFLLENRPLQIKLAYELSHTATAATWFHNPLNTDKLIFPRIEASNKTEEKKAEKFLPSTNWTSLIEKIKKELITSEKQNNLGLKKEIYKKFCNHLDHLKYITLMQHNRWKHDYLKAIRLWIDESKKKLKALDYDLQRYEPIAKNIYRSGESLYPDGYGKETFVGRNDICDELSFRILNSAIMPTIFLQGQRRVGKTSLLNFLSELLGSRFVVIQIDMQSDEFQTLLLWLKGLIKRGEAVSDLKYEKIDNFPIDILEGWREARLFFEKIAKKEERKIILAFDEYENLHKLIKEEGEKGERLLDAMRSFSQHQNQIIFLFAGLSLFADIGEPDFSRYFVHAHRLKVDYLDKKSSIKLITKPIENFNLIYPSEIAEKIYNLTCGHPALLQHICFEMVNLANRKSQKNIKSHDLDMVLDMVFDRSNHVITTFWKHFCNENMKKTVFEIINTNKSNQKFDLIRLLDYGFISEINKEEYKLRIPLFEIWIKKYGESF